MGVSASMAGQQGFKMMRYKCAKCGAIFQETDIVVNSYREYRGECFGFPTYETVSEDHCPNCNYNYFEEYFEEDEE